MKGNEAFAWLLQNGDLERAWPPSVPMSADKEKRDDNDNSNCGAAHELKSVIALSKVTAKEDEEMRRLEGRRGMCSDLTLPSEWERDPRYTVGIPYGCGG